MDRPLAAEELPEEPPKEIGAVPVDAIEDEVGPPRRKRPPDDEQRQPELRADDQSDLVDLDRARPVGQEALELGGPRSQAAGSA